MRMKGALVLLFILMLPMVVWAADVKGTSRTYIQIRETSGGDQLIPLYESLNFYIDDINARKVAFHFGGWVRQDLANKSFDNRKQNSDLQYAYLSAVRDENNRILNVGRVLVYEGVASELVDGLSAKTDLKGGFGLSAYGGIPVEADFDKRGGDSIYGGRFSYQASKPLRVGVSYLKEKNKSSAFREESGIDIWYVPVEKLEINGRSAYNHETSGWMEHAYFFRIGPFKKLRFTSEISKVQYENYFTSVSTTAFDIRTAFIDPKEESLILGGEAIYALDDNLSISADLKNYNYDVADSANYYGAKLTFTDPESKGAGCSLHRMDGEDEKNKYIESRIYAYKHFDKIFGTIDLFNVTYDKKINNVKNAYAASVSLGYSLKENARISADLTYSHDPDFDRDIRTFISFRYGFDFAYKK